MKRCSLAVAAKVAFAALIFHHAGHATPLPERRAPDTFLVQDLGLAFLGPDGRERGRIDSAGNGALSPDGRLLACIRFDHQTGRAKVGISPRRGGDESVFVPLVWDIPGRSGCLLVWAPDGRRLMIGENRPANDGTPEYCHRVYELANKKLTELDLPQANVLTGWSADAKRLLTTARAGEVSRVAWVNADGSGEPELLTPDNEVSYGARLSPDGRRILYQAGPKPPKGQRALVRLYVMELATKKRTAVDEPGETHGYCWSPDGAQVAYTWQRFLDKSDQGSERQTLLITCDREGKNRRTITSKKYKPAAANSGLIYFYWVVDWR